MANNDYLVRTVFDLVGMLTRDEVVIPADYRDRVLLTKRALDNDVSGIAGSMLDLAIKSACVSYRVETTNPELTKYLNNILAEINADLVGQIPVGLKALAKEYFRERWKGSSMCLLRTEWDDVDGFTIPTNLWLVDGEDIVVKDSSKGRVVSLGSMRYYLRVGNSNDDADLIPISNTDTHHYFVQKPFCSWTTAYPQPYLMKRGIYENLEFLRILIKRGEKIANRALEYLLIIKKGSEGLALKGTADTIYDDKDLKEIKEKFKDLILEQRTQKGTPTHVTNFDTDITDYIPDFAKAIGSEIYVPAEKRILNGIGLIELIPNGGSNRREAVFNPLPFINEINQGVEDFAMLLTDLLRVFVKKNQHHPKYNGQILRVSHSPVTEFLTADILDHFRSAYDRGTLSKQTYTEILGTKYEVERNRRIHEQRNGDEKTMYPPPTQNVEGKGQDVGEPGGEPTDDVPLDKDGPEAKNFKNAKLEVSCRNGHKFEVEKKDSLTTCNCPECREEVNY